MRKQNIFHTRIRAKSHDHENGFILVYTLILVAVILGIVGLNFSGSISEIFAARNEEQSMKAFYAADTGIECVRYWHSNYQVFDTSKPPNNYNCGIGADFSAGMGDPQCQAHTYTFAIQGFSNGACVDIKVTTVPRIITVNGNDITVCTLSVISSGKNSCTATGGNLVERVRWEDM